MDTLDKRMRDLTERYVEKAEINGNPLINELIDDYDHFNGGQEIKQEIFYVYSMPLI